MYVVISLYRSFFLTFVLYVSISLFLYFFISLVLLYYVLGSLLID